MQGKLSTNAALARIPAKKVRGSAFPTTNIEHREHPILPTPQPQPQCSVLSVSQTRYRVAYYGMHPPNPPISLLIHLHSSLPFPIAYSHLIYPRTSYLHNIIRKIPWRLSRHQKYRQRTRLRHVDTIVSTLDTALRRMGQSMKKVERWKTEMPTEQEMLPRDKYSVFDRKVKRYRKGIHSKLDFS